MAHNLAVARQGSKQAAEAIRAAYRAWVEGFEQITCRARARFEQRDWHGSQIDAAERLDLYRVRQDSAVAAMPAILKGALHDHVAWAAVRDEYTALLRGRPDRELAETFFNSVTRRVLGTVGVNLDVEFTESAPQAGAAEPPIYRSYSADAVDQELVRRMLEAFPWTVPYAQLDRDARLVAELINACFAGMGAYGPVFIDVLDSPFFRNKGAYVVGRIGIGGGAVPLVLPLLHAERGIVVDAVLMTEDEASIVFGFSWSYFRVEARRPRALVEFLRSIMPLKRVDELYNAVGYNKHGKTELYRTLMRHLDQSDARFAFAEGDEGLVMAVFTLPSLNVVFKVIKDSFAPPKNTTRRAVMEKYHFVFVRDRVGRLADAQEFGQLEFPKRCFPDDLLAYLLHVAGNTVRVEGERIVVQHLYTERRVVPLNLFLRTADAEAAREAVVDFGNAIKDLAAADIFTGDMLLKNFGITRHGRVICYDYDELCRLSECRFRRIPPPRTIEEEFAAEPWFSVGEHDVFPEEFSAFLAPPGELRNVFLEAHGDLLQVEFWEGAQRRLAAGEIMDVFPYKRSLRLQREA